MVVSVFTPVALLIMVSIGILMIPLSIIIAPIIFIGIVIYVCFVEFLKWIGLIGETKPFPPSTAQELLDKDARAYGMKIGISHYLVDGKDYLKAQKDGCEAKVVIDLPSLLWDSKYRLLLLESLNRELTDDINHHHN